MKCKICGVEFVSRDKVRNHIKEKHKKIWKSSNKMRMKWQKRVGLTEFVEK